ncbi:unnamed protein product, partial [Mesorhabditis belari]|uniref:Uncharacterized protein n=1 Tax=Mesorhabditis belari TaxID=2138241 RepID=A0AAF3EE52_9BILA
MVTDKVVVLILQARTITCKPECDFCATITREFLVNGEKRERTMRSCGCEPIRSANGRVTKCKFLVNKMRLEEFTEKRERARVEMACCRGDRCNDGPHPPPPSSTPSPPPSTLPQEEDFQEEELEESVFVASSPKISLISSFLIIFLVYFC